MTFLESFTFVERGVVVFCVKTYRSTHYFKSAVAANRDFPGAFDEPDS